MLEDKNIDPNLLDENKFNALTHAIKSEHPEIVAILLERTDVALEISFHFLAESAIDWKKPENSSFLGQIKMAMKIKIDYELFKGFLERVGQFGNSIWIDFLLHDFPEYVEKFLLELLDELTRDVIMSDNPTACKVIAEFANLNEDLKSLALKRGKREVLKALEISIPGDEQQTSTTNEDFITDPDVKTAEFSYSDSTEKIVNKWLKSKKTIWVPMDEVIETMVAPVVHYDEKKCPKNCKEKQVCLRTR